MDEKRVLYVAGNPDGEAPLVTPFYDDRRFKLDLVDSESAAIERMENQNYDVLTMGSLNILGKVTHGRDYLNNGLNVVRAGIEKGLPTIVLTSAIEVHEKLREMGAVVVSRTAGTPSSVLYDAAKKVLGI